MAEGDAQAWFEFDTAVAVWLQDPRSGRAPGPADAAVGALEAGCDSPSLRVLAGLESPGFFEVQERFGLIRGERGLAPLSERELAKLAIDDLLRRIVAGALPPQQGAAAAWSWTVELMDAGDADLDAIGALDDSYGLVDFGGDPTEELDAEVIRRSRELLERGGVDLPEPAGRHPSLDERHDPAIRVVDADPRWPAQARQEAEAIRAALAPLGFGHVRVEHFGSTAVPGLAGKPVIDLMVAVPDLSDAQPAIAAIEALGYLYAHNPQEPRRLFFGKPRERPRAFHVHLVETDTSELGRHLAVRDFLRSHPGEAAAYAALKRELVAASPEDRIAYIEGKRQFMFGLETRALAWVYERNRPPLRRLWRWLSRRD